MNRSFEVPFVCAGVCRISGSFRTLPQHHARTYLQGGVSCSLGFSEPVVNRYEYPWAFFTVVSTFFEARNRRSISSSGVSCDMEMDMSLMYRVFIIPGVRILARVALLLSWPRRARVSFYVLLPPLVVATLRATFQELTLGHFGISGVGTARWGFTIIVKILYHINQLSRRKSGVLLTFSIAVFVYAQQKTQIVP